MFELSGEAFVSGYGCPAIIQNFCAKVTGIDHRLNGEKHSLTKFHAFVRATIMKYAGRRVEHLAQAMAAEIPYYRKPVRFGISLDGVADIAQRRARLDDRDAPHEALVRRFDEPPGLDADLANRVHAA